MSHIHGSTVSPPFPRPFPIAPLSTMAAQSRDRPDESIGAFEQRTRLRVLQPWRGPWKVFRERQIGGRDIGQRTEPWVVAQSSAPSPLRPALALLHSSLTHLGRAMDAGSTRTLARLLRMGQEAALWFGPSFDPSPSPSLPPLTRR